MGINDHPDVARALLTGYPTFTDDENRDSEENRMAFFEDCPGRKNSRPQRWSSDGRQVQRKR